MPLIGLLLNYTPLGVRLVHVLIGRSLFTILLALVAYVQRAWVSEAERFVVEGWGHERQRELRQGRETILSRRTNYLLVSIMKLKAIHKDEASKPIPMIGKVGLEGGEVGLDVREKKIFGILRAWKVDSQELKEELRAMHG